MYTLIQYPVGNLNPIKKIQTLGNMKKIFTLCFLTVSILCSRAQVILNEIYVQPGNGYNEFFELYNTSPGPGSENMDNYTIVAYYEQSNGTNGFYVMDLPNMSVAPKGYFVGASANPFSIQSQPNMTADFNWNAMPAGGAITKWENNGSGYTQVPVPANLNDFFVKNNGSGAVYHVFVYKDGILVNAFIGGYNLSAIPPYIRAMPNLFVNMTGSAPDFTIDWTAIPNNRVEYTTNAVGTNNGYYREFDGKCGAWLKSDQPGQHNPGSTNGSAANEFGEITIAAVITAYEPDPTKSVLTYEIKNGPAAAFPVLAEVYIDNDSVGALDANDYLLDTRMIMDINAGSQDIILPDTNIAALVVLRSPAGCYDLVLALEKYSATLPVKVYNFHGNLSTSRTTLGWTIANNETADRIDVERSTNGRDFISAAVIFTEEKSGTAEYYFKENITLTDKIYYRLKITDKAKQVTYSDLLLFRNRTNKYAEIKIAGNPVRENLVLNYTASETKISDLKIYDQSGKLVLNQKLNTVEGINSISIPLNASMKPGLYITEIRMGYERQTGKFLKL
jgi:hypothetical protein